MLRIYHKTYIAHILQKKCLNGNYKVRINAITKLPHGMSCKWFHFLPIFHNPYDHLQREFRKNMLQI